MDDERTDRAVSEPCFKGPYGQSADLSGCARTVQAERARNCDGLHIFASIEVEEVAVA
jgi:hypothetical protein